MRFSFFNANWSTANKVSVGLSLACFMLSCSNLFLLNMLSQQKERIILTPPTIDQEYKIGWDSANTEYYQAHAVMLAGIIGSTTSKTLSGNLKTLSKFTSQGIQRQLQESLNALVNKLPSENFNAWFSPKNVYFERQTNKIFVQGSLQSSLVSSKIQEQPVVYEFIIRMQAGKPIVTHFNSYEGTKPLTIAQIKANELAAEQRSNQQVRK